MHSDAQQQIWAFLDSHLGVRDKCGPKRWLYVLGAKGIGKTTMCKEICESVQEMYPTKLIGYHNAYIASSLSSFVKKDPDLVFVDEMDCLLRWQFIFCHAKLVIGIGNKLPRWSRVPDVIVTLQPPSADTIHTLLPKQDENPKQTKWLTRMIANQGGDLRMLKQSEDESVSIFAKQVHVDWKKEILSSLPIQQFLLLIVFHLVTKTKRDKSLSEFEWQNHVTKKYGSGVDNVFDMLSLLESQGLIMSKKKRWLSLVLGSQLQMVAANRMDCKHLSKADLDNIG